MANPDDDQILLDLDDPDDKPDPSLEHLITSVTRKTTFTETEEHDLQIKYATIRRKEL